MIYTIKVWLFTVIISPLLLALILGVLINNPSFSSILNSYEIIFVTILVGLFLSMPAMMIFGFIKRFLNNKVSVLKEKTILSIYSFLSVWITFFVVDKGFVTKWTEQTVWVIIYSIMIILGVWMFKNPAKVSDHLNGEKQNHL